MGFKQTKFTNPFPQIAQRAKPAAAQATEETAAETLELAQGFAPVDTGELRDSGMIEQVDETHQIVKFTSGHARFVHYGTIFQNANPFLFRAFEAMRPAFREKRKELVRNILRG